MDILPKIKGKMSIFIVLKEFNFAKIIFRINALKTVITIYNLQGITLEASD
jgi:hypothetical protein